MSYDRVARLLSNQQVVVLDGALGTEVKRRGAKEVDHPDIWSTPGLIHFPSLVLQTHVDYVLAGADVITAGAFRTNRTALRKAGLEDLSRPLTHLAVNLANEVKRKLYLHRGFEICVAGNITAVEDCYSPGRSPGEGASDEHSEKALFLAEAGCDLILIESMPTIIEGICAVKAARAVCKPVWLSFILMNQCHPPQLLDGTEVVDIPRLLDEANALPDALLFNCSWPDVISDALVHLKEHLNGLAMPMGAYANVERQVDPCGPWARMTEVSPQAYAAFAAQWARLGAQIIGGCCGTTPDDIRSIKQAVGGRAHVVVAKPDLSLGHS
ncbi:MAG TPA: homocysteine S-methyltransferase family protein [Thermoanaerobaculia bacterium]|nr:homocysteine S-methyltransferase family protein [Thermoanaerobaculia bacterium]